MYESGGKSDEQNQPMKNNQPKMALWECECGNITVQRLRWKPGEPDHVNCHGRMVFIRDVE